MGDSAIIILAGGAGTRFGQDKPKQLTMLAGKTILEHLLINVSGCTALNQIVVVGRDTILDEIKAICERVVPGRVTVVAGGSNRLASTRAGLTAVSGPDATKVLIHDGVRPFLKHSTIFSCIKSLDDYDVVDVVIPSADTLVSVDPKDQNVIGEIPSRSNFRRGQTPQGFWLGKLRDVIDNIPDLENVAFTDDCGLYLSALPDTKIGLVDGDETNIKITHPIDLFIAEQLIMSGQTVDQLEVEARDLTGFNIVLFGGTSGLGADASQSFSDLGMNVYSASRQTGVDVTNAVQVAAFLEKTAKDAGSIDAVVNFAGILNIGPLVETEQSVIEDVVRINFLGSINVARQSHKYLKSSDGQLVLISSSSYYRGRKDYAVYSASKAAVVNMTQALSEEWIDDGIRVNCIVPRRANTPMRWDAFPDEDKMTLLQPAEVSLALLRLLKSSDSGLINHVY